MAYRVDTHIKPKHTEELKKAIASELNKEDPEEDKLSSLLEEKKEEDEDTEGDD